MCGIVSAISLTKGGFTNSEARSLYESMVANAVRGYDSVGYMFTDDKGDIRYRKDVGSVTTMISRDGFVSEVAGSSFFIGHNRAATIGDVKKETAHPFMFENVYGVHNGTISSWRYTLRKHGDKAESDSDALYRTLDKTKDDAAAVSEVLSSVESGAYAMVWYDTRLAAVRFARNHDRPLYCIATDGALFLSSELRMMDWVLARNRISVRRAVSVRPHALVTVPMDTRTPSVSEYTASYRRYPLGYQSNDYYSYSRHSTGYARDTRGPYCPKTIRVSSVSDLSARHYITNTVEKRVKASIAAMIGRPDLTYEHVQPSLYEVLRDTAEKRLMGEKHGGYTYLVPMEVADITQTGRMYGRVLYTDPDTGKSELRMATVEPGLTQDYKALAETIRSYLSAGVTPLYTGARLAAIEVGHNGSLAYGLSPVRNDDNVVTDGTAMTKAERNIYGLNHPIRKALATATTDWTGGWGKLAA